MITVSRQSRPRETPAVGVEAAATGQHALWRLVILHLIPGAIFTIFIFAAATALDAWGIDPIFALFSGIGLVLVPLELGYLALWAKRTTGSWSPLNAVDYTNPIPLGRLIGLAGGLAVWFLVGLVVSIVFLDEWFAEH